MKSLIILGFFVVMGCSQVYYGFWETLGKEKRDLLKGHIENAIDDQSNVKETFKDSLERIRKEYSFAEGKLEETYDNLSADYKAAKSQSETLRERVDKINTVASDLFVEWQKEAQSLNNRKYKSVSLAKLAQTKSQFRRMLKKMRAVEYRLKNVLKKLEDNVLFLKHNLNAKVLGNFKLEFSSIEKEMKKAMSQISLSNTEAEDFIEAM